MVNEVTPAVTNTPKVKAARDIWAKPIASRTQPQTIRWRSSSCFGVTVGKLFGVRLEGAKFE
jgi:hypothetical protein